MHATLFTKESRSKAPFKEFRGVLKQWNTLLQQTADFAGTIAPDMVISISHSSGRIFGVVTVWYCCEGV